jgi:hypothetical protein
MGVLKGWTTKECENIVTVRMEGIREREKPRKNECMSFKKIRR